MNPNRQPYRPPSNHSQSNNNYQNNGKAYVSSGPAPVPNVEPPPETEADAPVIDEKSPVLDELRYKNNYNPPELDLEGADTARFLFCGFLIQSRASVCKCFRGA